MPVDEAAVKMLPAVVRPTRGLVYHGCTNSRNLVTGARTAGYGVSSSASVEPSLR